MYEKYLPSSKRFLTPEQIAQGAEEMAILADADGARAVLIGGAALYYYGSLRMTVDVDFAATEMVQAKRIGRITFGGAKLQSLGGIPIDWVVRNDEYKALYRAAISDPLPARRTTAPAEIARPEYLLAMKMAAGRGKDQADIEWMVASGVVDLAKAKKVVRKFLGPYAVGELESTVREVEWRKSQGLL